MRKFDTGTEAEITRRNWILDSTWVHCELAYLYTVVLPDLGCTTHSRAGPLISISSLESVVVQPDGVSASTGAPFPGYVNEDQLAHSSTTLLSVVMWQAVLLKQVGPRLLDLPAMCYLALS